MSGLGNVGCSGALGDCGSDQIQDPSLVVGGYAQCVSTQQYLASHPGARLVFDGTKWIDQGAGVQQSGAGQGGDTWSNIAGAISKIFGATQQAPVAPVMVDSGPSTGTILAIGAAGLAAVYLITRK